MERLDNKNCHVNCLITYMFIGLEHEKKIRYMCFIELHLVLLVKLMNKIPKTINLMVCFIFNAHR